MVKAETTAGSAKNAPLGLSIPLPSGMSHARSNQQLPLAVSDIQSLRFRRVYCYLGEIKFLPDKESTPISCETAAPVHSAAHRWRRYGSLPDAEYDIRLYLHALAFTSASSFDPPIVMLKVGDPISGFPDAAKGGHLAAQLPGRGPVSAEEWELRPPRSSRPGGFGLKGDAISFLPSIAMVEFAHYHFPNAP